MKQILTKTNFYSFSLYSHNFTQNKDTLLKFIINLTSSESSGRVRGQET